MLDRIEELKALRRDYASKVEGQKLRWQYGSRVRDAPLSPEEIEWMKDRITALDQELARLSKQFDSKYRWNPSWGPQY